METENFNRKLRKLVYAGAATRYKDLTPAIVCRIETEVYTICQHGMAKDFVLWGNHAAKIKEKGVLLNLKTGTAPGSIVNY